MHSFGQRRQLPALAPYVPVEDPQLRSTAYDMVLAALLLAPVHHKLLLALVHRWPSHLYNLQAFTEATLRRCTCQPIHSIIKPFTQTLILPLLIPTSHFHHHHDHHTLSHTYIRGTLTVNTETYAHVNVSLQFLT